METDVSFSIEDEQQFWDELRIIVTARGESHEAIDDTLRAYLALTTTSKHEYLNDDYSLSRCCYELLGSDLFRQNQQYVRRQFIYCILQEDDASTLQIIAAILLFDGRSDEETFQLMQQEGGFARMLELIQTPEYDGSGLHKMLLELLCDMSRIQQLSWEDLKMVDDAFILYLFQRIEELSDDASDPYHYAIIRILLVFNEQYMCFAQDSQDAEFSSPIQPPLTNRIMKILSAYGPVYRTFGENLILLLNREISLGPQLLILKLLYLLFTTPPTFEYFYTNDLHVLVDVIIRNLLDLDPGFDDDDSPNPTAEGSGQKSLRHTYLRVLYPLLRNTQLAQEDGHYKREELRRLFQILVNKNSFHFAPVDATVVRLVSRCKQVEWIRDETDEPTEVEKLVAKGPPHEGDVAKKLLGMNLVEAGVSNLSVVDVTAKMEREEKKRPVVPPRRRNKRAAQEQNQSSGDVIIKVPLPAVSGTLSVDMAQDDSKSPFSDDENND